MNLKLGKPSRIIIALSALFLSACRRDGSTSQKQDSKAPPQTKLSRDRRASTPHRRLVTETPEQIHDHLISLLGVSTEKAIEWTESRIDPDDIKTARTQLVLEWVQRDPEAAWKWASEHPEALQLQLTLGYSLSTTSPKVALEYAGTMASSKERDALLADAAARWAADHPEDAIAWADSIYDTTLNAAVISAISSTTAARDPQQAARLVAGMEAGIHQDRAAFTVVQLWLQHDSDACASWVNTWPDSALKDEILQHCVQ